MTKYLRKRKRRNIYVAHGFKGFNPWLLGPCTWAEPHDEAIHLMTDGNWERFREHRFVDIGCCFSWDECTDKHISSFSGPLAIRSYSLNPRWHTITHLLGWLKCRTSDRQDWYRQRGSLKCYIHSGIQLDERGGSMVSLVLSTHTGWLTQLLVCNSSSRGWMPSSDR